jgi:hypothetical protein
LGWDTLLGIGLENPGTNEPGVSGRQPWEKRLAIVAFILEGEPSLYKSFNVMLRGWRIDIHDTILEDSIIERIVSTYLIGEREAFEQ